MSSVRWPKIGRIVRCSDGSYDVGPLPDIGGPFDTATTFFEVWATKAEFPFSEDSLWEMSTKFQDQENPLITSIHNFPNQLKALASYISSWDGGPFPLYHTDFLHSNIVIDDQYGVLGELTGRTRAP